MNRKIVGIDSGGTHTTILVVNEAGQQVGCGEGGCGNQNVVGLDTLVASVTSAAQAAGLGVPPFTDISYVVAGLSGVDGAQSAAEAESVLTTLFPGAFVLAVPDTEIALRACIPQGAGVVVVAGTGAMAYGRDGNGLTADSSGWGPLVGDEGSAYFVGRMGISAALKAHDGRGKDTLLWQYLKDVLGCDSRQDIVNKLYGSGWGVAEIAAFSTHVSSAATLGDAVAISILDEAARELASAAAAVVRRLNLVNRVCPVGIVGGLCKSGPPLFTPLHKYLKALAPQTQLLTSSKPPVFGAVLMGLELLKVGGTEHA